MGLPLRLTEERPEANERFIAFLEEKACDAESLYILGDFFEYWIGDDDLGEPFNAVIAGLRQHYPPEQLVGKQIVVVANLAPRQMRGEISNGMLLAATDPQTNRVIVVTPGEPVAAGSKVS